MKNNKAITLIALVITIVVLIILAAVAINLSLGNNGIFNRAKTGKEMYQNAEEYEKQEIGKATNRMDSVQSNREDVQGVGNPIGCIIAQMGTSAPNGYLACDGEIYNISDYSDLAEYIKEQFGSYDYFKIGDESIPSDKFKVPDLRGEFLRGTGTNVHEYGGSAESVGVHQTPTQHINFIIGGSGEFYNNAGSSHNNNYMDSILDIGKSRRAASTTSGATSWSNSYYTSRPTNTAVLYCIKY